MDFNSLIRVYKGGVRNCTAADPQKWKVGIFELDFKASAALVSEK